MKIAISTGMIQRGRTGIAQYVFALLRAFEAYADEHEFRVYIFEEDLPLFEFMDPRMKKVVVGERYRPALRNIAWHQTVFPGELARESVDVVHVPSYRRLMWRAPCAMVGTIHDLAPFRVTAKYDPLRMFYGRVVVRRLAMRQHEVIAISENTARDIREFFCVKEDRLTVIWNGLEHDRFHPVDREAACAWVVRKHGLDRPFFLYVSRLEHPGKNHVRLIEAYDRHRRTCGEAWQLAIAGGDWSGSEAIKARAAASPYAGDIRFLGFIPDVDLPQLYNAASTVVYPSLYEGFGLPPVEAMACGCPVISSPNGSLAEVVGDAAERVDPESEDDMARGLTRLVMEPERRQELRAAGLINAARFRWEDTAARTMDVYRKAWDRWRGR